MPVVCTSCAIVFFRVNFVNGAYDFSDKQVSSLT